MTLTGTDGRTLYEFSPNDVIAKGGTSNVFKGRNISTGETIAVKVYYRELTARKEILERIITESKIKLHSPHFVEVYDLIKTNNNGDNIYHLITEYIDGTSLSEIIKKGPLSKEFTLQIATIVSEFLDKLHNFKDPLIENQSKICHRDINPSNILISKNDKIKVIDLGIAKVHYTDNRPRITKVNQVLGTTAYMPPEQFNEGVFGGIDTYSDFYSLAITLYECLTGNVPFWGANEFELYHEILNKEIPPHPNLSPSLNTFFKKATAKNPSERFNNGIEFIKEFNSALFPITLKKKQPNILVWLLPVLGTIFLFVYIGLKVRDRNTLPIPQIISPLTSCKLCTLGLPPTIFNEDSISALKRAGANWKTVNNEKSRWLGWFNNPDNFKYQINTSKLELDPSMYQYPVQKLLIHVINTTTLHSEEKKSEMLNSTLDFSNVDRIRNILKSDFQEKSNILSNLNSKLIRSTNRYKHAFDQSYDYLISSRNYDLALETAELLDDKLKSSQIKFLMNKSYSIPTDILQNYNGEYGFLALDIAAEKYNVNEVAYIGNYLINKIDDSLSIKSINRSILISNIYFFDYKNQVDSTLFHFSQLTKLIRKAKINKLLTPDSKKYSEWLLDKTTKDSKYEPITSLLTQTNK